MSWLDWLFLVLNAVTYALGHYHGNNRGTAKANDGLAAVVSAINASAEQAGIAGAVAGAAAYNGNSQSGPPSEPPKVA